MTDSHFEKDCLFCDIVQKKIPSQVVYEDDTVLAFEDIIPQAPVHLLVIPKTHIPSLADLKPGDERIMADLFSAIRKLAEEQNLIESGFRTVMNTGEGAGQTVFHLHIHLMGGRTFQWPPG